jgi:hypothetical protein
MAMYLGLNSLGIYTNLEGSILLKSEILFSGIIILCSMAIYKFVR